ncbi:Hypothetical predicted protein [Podarcis lilfordi]|uniref:Uncharacterized protein n=1 Tax=Podarcis lilfordi TaxID=74358 RepID=A0AA35LAF4_9SAUR|nr:Hypothetical predicted protein [Podarcis lilfordi]
MDTQRQQPLFFYCPFGSRETSSLHLRTYASCSELKEVRTCLFPREGAEARPLPPRRGRRNQKEQQSEQLRSFAT